MIYWQALSGEAVLLALAFLRLIHRRAARLRLVRFVIDDPTAVRRILGAPCAVRSTHAPPDSRPFNLIGIAIGRAQAQYSKGAQPRGANRGANHCRRPGARKEAAWNCLSFNVGHQRLRD